MPMINKEVPFPSSAISQIPPNVAVLSSWKDIARFLGKGVRTAQRWEKDLGLPVRRVKQPGKSAVLAIPGEINDWVCLQSYSNGRRKDTPLQREELLRRVQQLQSENAELRRQMQMHCEKSA